MRLLLACAIVCSSVTFAAADDDVAAVADSNARVHFQRQEGALLLDVKEAADAFGWEAKLVTPNKLLTVCRKGPTAVCIPIRLDKTRWLQQRDDLFVDAAQLEKALSFRVETANNVVTLRRVKRPADDAAGDIPAYNAEWGAGRGFRVGQTLPDIPLYDMQGHEVRFSQYLGKQLAIYVWASW